MMRNRVLRAVSIVTVGVIATAAVVLFLIPISPPEPSPPPPAVPIAEQARTIDGLKPPKRAAPVIAVLALNDQTEITDYLIPYSVLRQSQLGEVIAVAIKPEPIKTYRGGLLIEPQATTKQLDQKYPEGVDYVIVPAMEPRTDAEVIAWLKVQADKGATIVSVCRGALTLGAAGLLDGRSATTHWSSIDELRASVTTMHWVKDRRYVVDGGVATATGITASLPTSLALVEAIGGRDRAAKLAAQLGVGSWDARHDSAAFHIDASLGRTAARNLLGFWRYQTLGLKLENDVDEIVLALAIDAYSRTWHTEVALISGEKSITTRHGLRVFGKQDGDAKVDQILPDFGSDKPAQAIGRILDDIAQRYDEPTAAFVAVQLEYPWRGH